jgi:hypothetical protein
MLEEYEGSNFMKNLTILNNEDYKSNKTTSEFEENQIALDRK